MRRSGRTDHRASPQGACAVRPRRAYGPRAARGPRPRPAPTRLQQVARRSGLRASLQRRRWKLPPPEPSRTAFRPGPLAFACICCVRIRSSRSSRDHLTLRRVPRSTRVRVALSRSPVRDGLPPAAYQGGLETVLEEEEFEIPPRAVQGPETAKGWEPTALAASSSISRHERDTDSRSCVEIPGREAGSASARSAAYASHLSMVPLAASILPAARETTSSGSPSPALAASTSSAASTAVSEIPAQVTAVRIASLLKYGSLRSSPGSPRTARTGAPSKTTRWLSEARMPAALNHAVSTFTLSERST